MENVDFFCDILKLSKVLDKGGNYWFFDFMLFLERFIAHMSKCFVHTVLVPTSVMLLVTCVGRLLVRTNLDK